MEQMIRAALRRYREYLAEAKLEEQSHITFPGSKSPENLRILEMKLVVLNCWLCILNEVEQFVIRRHLIDGADLPLVSGEFLDKWGNAYGRSKRSLQKYEANALRRIEAFSMVHMDVIAPLFDLLSEEGAAYE